MNSRFAGFALAENGSAVFDRLILATGVLLMAISVVLAIAPAGKAYTDDTHNHVEHAEEVRPA